MATEYNRQENPEVTLGLAFTRTNPKPIDASSYFNDKVEAEEYASNGATSYVGQILQVNEEGNVKLYKIADIKGRLVPIYDEDNISSAGLEPIGFQGDLPGEGVEITGIKRGYEYVLQRDIYKGAELIAHKNDYMIYHSDNVVFTVPTDTGWTDAILSQWVILEQNITGAITGISNADKEQGSYICGAKIEDNKIHFLKENLPSVSIVGGEEVSGSYISKVILDDAGVFTFYHKALDNSENPLVTIIQNLTEDIVPKYKIIPHQGQSTCTLDLRNDDNHNYAIFLENNTLTPVDRLQIYNYDYNGRSIFNKNIHPITIRFKSGDAPTTFVYTDSEILWMNDEIPTIEPYTEYLIALCDGIGILKAIKTLSN